MQQHNQPQQQSVQLQLQQQQERKIPNQEPGFQSCPSAQQNQTHQVPLRIWGSNAQASLESQHQQQFQVWQEQQWQQCHVWNMQQWQMHHQSAVHGKNKISKAQSTTHASRLLQHQMNQNNWLPLTQLPKPEATTSSAEKKHFEPNEPNDLRRTRKEKSPSSGQELLWPTKTIEVTVTRKNISTHPETETKPRALPAIRKKMVIGDESAKALESFIRRDKPSVTDTGTDSNIHLNEQSTDGGEVDDSRERLDCEKKFFSEMEKSYWIHFKPLESIRSGIPYHRLELDEKVTILEFLMDELLSIDVFGAIFSYRHTNAKPSQFPYGSLPTKEQFDDIANEDECGICCDEGDLLCCDGCVRSYHRECIGLCENQVLGKGKWYCPECRIVDPSMFGPLDGGYKSTLDWFNVGELSTLHDASNQKESTPENGTQKVAVADTTNRISGLDVKKKEDQENCNQREFLVIHGFVFCRNSTRKKQENTTTNGSENMPQSFSRTQVEELLAEIGVNLAQSWPLAQIPRSGYALPLHLLSSSDYFSEPSSTNPCLYENRYEDAPVTILTKAGGVNQVARLQQLSYEKQCHRLDFCRISDLLPQDVSLDAEIRRMLKLSSALFDPYEPCAKYMLELEKALNRVNLLSPRWDEGQFITVGAKWVARVMATKSVHRLAKLLLRLIDEIHPRAFQDFWHENPYRRTKEADPVISESSYHALPDDWNMEIEKTLRGWRTTPATMILSQCSDDGKELDAFASKIQTAFSLERRINIVKSKKTSKTVVGNCPVDATLNKNEINGCDQDLVDTNETFYVCSEKNMTSQAVRTKDPENPPNSSKQKRKRFSASKRRNTRHSSSLAGLDAFGGGPIRTQRPLPLVELKGMTLEIENAKKEKLRSLQSLAKGPCFREERWPIAGRRIYPTVGNLSHKEVKCLARRAGNFFLPGLTYDVKREVAQVCYSHIWRKRIHSCVMFEEFLLLIRILESSLDRDVSFLASLWLAVSQLQLLTNPSPFVKNRLFALLRLQRTRILRARVQNLPYVAHDGILALES
jgi:hypothetical protein